MSQVVFVGHWRADRPPVLRVVGQDVVHEVHLIRPDGADWPLDWGRPGEGTLATAYGILRNLFGDTAQVKAATPLFAEEVIQHLPVVFSLTEAEVLAWVFGLPAAHQIAQPSAN